MPQFTKRDKSNKCWTKFINKTKQFADLPLTEWNEYQWLGYILNKVEVDFGYSISLCEVDSDKNQEYTIVNASNPSRHPTLLILRNQIINKLHNKETAGMPKECDHQMIKDYFDFSIAKSKGNFHNIKYLAHPDFINEFKKNKYKKKIVKLDRSTELPDTIKALIPDVTTYGDLAFYNMARTISSEVLDELKRLGVDLSKIS